MHHPAPTTHNAARSQADGSAWWRWQESRRRRGAAAVLATAQVAGCGAGLAALVAAAGGGDVVGLEFETLDQGVLSRLALGLILFWVSRCPVLCRNACCSG